MSQRLQDDSEFTIYKYSNEDKTIAGISTNSRFPSIDQVLELVDIAKRDFPDLSLEDIKICPDYQKRKWGREVVAEIGIEFDVPVGAYVPDDYCSSRLGSLHVELR
jgi:hypothetical protein